MIYKTNTSARIRFNANGTDACVLTTCGAMVTYFTRALVKPIDLTNREVVEIQTIVRDGSKGNTKKKILWFQIEEIYKAV